MALLRLPDPVGTRVRVPLRLGGVTTVHDEAPPASVGLSDSAVGRIWRAVELMFRTGLHPGISLVVHHRGRPVLARAIGHRRTDGEELMTPDTPACLFSCSKAITAVVVHKLAEDGVIGLDDTVASYLPEFGVNGKDHVTIRDLLTHRAGLARIPIDDPDPMLLFDVEFVVDELCAAPLANYSRQAYHAVTSGYILGAVTERAAGRGLPELLAELLAPLDARTVTYGVPPERRDDVALSYTTGATRLPVLRQAVGRLIGLDPDKVAPAMNHPLAMSRVLPAAGIWAGATDVARIFQLLLDGGRWNGQQVLAERTVAEAVRPAGPLVIDATLPAPIRFSAGFMLGERLGSLYGTNTAQAFGHLGFTNVL
ncbi:MAG TPA: serine hydrolase domain-containing protein, partial [Gaiellales bacterium]|nr:serine hydrolase domain-containing protein [Gaiellales bacterium]